MHRIPFVLGLVVAMVCARTARAEDAEDPGALLRKARTTEAADRDVAAAIPMYRKVMALAPASDAARDAGLRLLELLEQRGEKTAALEVAVALTERLSARLDDDAKRQVHEAMARMLPAGSKARSPLGEIYVVPPANAPSAASPLEAKVFALLPRLDAAPAGSNELENVLRIVGSIGEDAVVPLAKILRTERLDRAQFAARALARIATPGALGVLAAATKEGDGFVRSAALIGLRAVEASPAASPAIVRVVAPLLDDPALAGSREALRAVLGAHADDAEVERRVARPDADRSFWLGIALKRGLASAGPALADVVATGQTLDPYLMEAIAGAAGLKNLHPGPTGPVVELRPGLTPATRLAALRLLIAAPPTEYRMQVVANVAIGCVHAGDAAVATAAAAAVWPWVLRAPENARPDIGVDVLARGAVPLPSAVVEDDALVAALLEAWVRTSYGSGVQPTGVEVAVLTPPVLRARPAFAIALAGFAPDMGGPKVRRERIAALLATLNPRALPAPASAAWRDVLGRLSTHQFGDPDGVGMFALRVACAANDPRALDAIRRMDRSLYGPLEQSVGVILAEYTGADRSALAVDLLATRREVGRFTTDHRWKIRDDLILASLHAHEFYVALADRLDADTPAATTMLALLVGSQPAIIYDRTTAAAAPLAERWLAVLRRLDPSTPAWAVEPSAYLLARWATAGAPTSTLALAQSLAAGSASAPTHEVVFTALVSALANTAGTPGGRDFLVALSRRPALRDDVAEAVAEGLARPGNDGDFARLEEMAASRTGPGAPAALNALANGRHRDALIRIVSGLAGRTVPPSPWTGSLRLACVTLRLEEALPWLLAELKAGDPAAVSEIAQAIDTIQAHHARIAQLEARATATRDARAELEPMLDDPDPDLRVAAILSYAAITGRDGLPRLLRLAKDEKDPGIRRTILETVDRIAKAPAPAEPVPANAPRAGEGK